MGINPKHHIKKSSQLPKATHTLCDRFIQNVQNSKSLETKTRLVVARDGGQENGAVTANGDRFPFGVKKMSWNQTDVRLHKRGMH